MRISISNYQYKWSCKYYSMSWITESLSSFDIFNTINMIPIHSIPVKINQNSSSYPNQPVFPESSTSTWCSASVVLLSWVTLISVGDSVVNFASVAFTLKRIKRTPGSQKTKSFELYSCPLPAKTMRPDIRSLMLAGFKSWLGLWDWQLTIGVDHEVHLMIGQNRTKILPGEHICGCVSTTVL